MLSLLIISQTGCGNKEAVTGSDEYLDTVCEITLYGCDEDEAQEIITGGFRVIADNEALLSKTVEGSDVAEGSRESIFSGCNFLYHGIPYTFFEEN